MGNEYKDTIQDSIIHYYDHVLLYREYTDDVLDELDHVYAQAAKADEYEAKAAAFDEVIDLYVNGSNKYLQTKRHTLDVFIEDVAEILKPFTDECESGETNV